jgi:hypothetical protein
LPAERAEWLEADVFQALRDFRLAGRKFDLIVLDPPKFAPSAAHADRAARAYKDINVLGCRLLKPGGLLMTYSCSGGIGLELFQKIVAGAAHDAGREARIVQRLAGAADHPVALNFPEGEYLKGCSFRWIKRVTFCAERQMQHCCIWRSVVFYSCRAKNLTHFAFPRGNAASGWRQGDAAASARVVLLA